MNVPILEVGGTHVTAAWVDPSDWAVLSSRRRKLDADAPASELVVELAAAAIGLQAPSGARWGIAMPGPFDYARGVAQYAGVGKFEHLYGIKLRDELTRALRAQGTAPAVMTFLNDASAFLIGEWLVGAAKGHRRSMALTLGTGVGSAFLADGVIVDAGPEVPEQGEVHLLTREGSPLEDWVSRRAIRRRYAEATAARADGPDVAEIFARARAGELAAQQVLASAFRALGEVIAPWAKRFKAEVIVIGGSISQSFDLIESPLRTGLADNGVSLVPARWLETSSLIGTAYAAYSADGGASARTLSTSTGPSPAPSPTSP